MFEIGTSTHAIAGFGPPSKPFRKAVAEIAEQREGDRIKRRYDTPYGPLFETARFTVDRTWRVVEFAAKRVDDLPTLYLTKEYREP